MEATRLIEQLRQGIAADDTALAEARRRRDAVLGAALTFPGALRTFRSGSLATGFVNRPVADADCGLVLDRRRYPELGPDGDGVLPGAVVERIQNHIRPSLRERYPQSSIWKMKRGLLIKFNAPLDAEQDPTVDVVISLNRQKDEALWIPNLDEDRWDPSHPKKHVELFTSGPPNLRRTRAQVARLAKAQVKQFEEPTLSSFNVVALAWESVHKSEPLVLALFGLFEHAASELPERLTQDPAEVSGPIALPDNLDPDGIASRLHRAREGLKAAIDAGGDEEKARSALAGVYPGYLENPNAQKERGELASQLRKQAPVPLVGLGTVPPSTSYGGRA